jgi:site-specific DNA recombinase
MNSSTHDRCHDAPLTRARVVFYGRVARDEQPLLSLQRQVRTVRAVLGTMAPIVRCYADVGPHTGLGTGGRSVAGCLVGDEQVAGGIDQLLARAASAERDFEVVVCSSIDRISKRPLDGVRIEAALAEHAVRLVAADEPTSHVLSALADVPDARAMTTRATLRRWAWELVTDERTRLSNATRERLLDQGWHVGPVPYGYTSDTVIVAGARRRRLLVEPTQATIVQSIFSSYVCQRRGVTQIARDLNQSASSAVSSTPHTDGPPRQWTGSQIRAVVSNPVYTGYRVTNRRDATRRPRPVHEWTWSKKTVRPRIVPQDVFLTAQRITTDRRPSPQGRGNNTAVKP